MKLKNFIKFMGFATAGLAVGNYIIDNRAKNKDCLSPYDGYYFTWKEGEVFYSVRGSGSPILLVHDLNVISNSFEWNRLRKYLEKDHKVYCIDLPGCGLSEKPSITYTNYLYVQLLDHFSKEVIGEKCDVIAAHDSVAAVVMAQKINDLFNKIVLINPTDFETMNMETTRLDMFFKNIMYLPVIGTAIYNYGTSEKKISEILLAYFSQRSEWDKCVDAYYKSAHLDKSKGRYLYACKRCNYLGGDITAALSDMKNVFIITGRDYVTSDRLVYSYLNINSKIKTFSIRNTKQVPQLEDPKSTYEVLQNIL